MENWPILLVLLMVHILMVIGAVIPIMQCPYRTFLDKFALFLIALLIPILGVIYVTSRFKNTIYHNGQWIDTTDAYGMYRDSSNHSSDSDGGDSGGGGGSD